MLKDSPLYAYLPAKDVARARAFYETKLGFVAASELDGGVTYTFGAGTACFLYPTPNAGTNRASQAFWKVEDIEASVAELTAKGVAFEHYEMPGATPGSPIVTSARTKAAWFLDTEGNILALIQDT